MSRGPYVQLHTGTQWHFLDPRPEDVRFDDMIGLSRMARYLGATTIDPYSVAEHCVRGAERLAAGGCDRRTCLAFLLHDPEHIPPGDLPGPMLRALEKVEAAIRSVRPEHEDETLKIRRLGERAVWGAFGVLDAFTPIVWEMDKIMLATERRDIMAASSVDWGPLPKPLPDRIVPWSNARAWHEFQRAFDEFGGVRR